MDYLDQSFSVRFDYKVYFTSNLFSLENDTFRHFLKSKEQRSIPKIFFIIDGGVAQSHPTLLQDIKQFFAAENNITLINEIMIIPGGEVVKNSTEYVEKIIHAVDHFQIDRHSYIAAIGGGAVLDMVGFAAAISHRGVRHIRIPTTVLSQNDSGVGVKNSINWSSKKNFVGTFVPPVAVMNDSQFLTSLSDGEWRSGISEAIKVGLIKDAAFFQWIASHTQQLVARDMPTMQYLIKRCAALHMQHIAGKDPFETGSNRPLDFGHWSAHKLEQLTKFAVRHGDAVAMGIALDSAYAYLEGRLAKQELDQIISVIQQLGFELTHHQLHVDDSAQVLLNGLEEFREHLGGQLTITLLNKIGEGVEVHEMDHDLIAKASNYLQSIGKNSVL
jgi:3-dehydroquinate synthase